MPTIANVRVTANVTVAPNVVTPPVIFVKVMMVVLVPASRIVKMEETAIGKKTKKF
jgi:hypothetical protein